MKNPITTLLFLLAFTPLVHAQDVAPAVTPANSPWRFGITASADYNTNVIYYRGYLPLINALTFFEHPAMGWTAGATAEYRLSRHFALTGGLRYREHRLTSGTITITDEHANKIGTMKMNFNYRYIDMPLGIQYTSHPDSRLTFIANATLTPGYALGQWNVVKADGAASTGIQEGRTKSDIPNFNSFSLTSELYAGAGISFGRCQLQVLPNARVNLLKVSSDALVNRRNWSMGVDFRLMIRL